MQVNTKKILGLFLLNKREELDLTQSELSERSGITRATIVKIEAGNNNTSLDATYKLIYALNSRFEEFEKFLKKHTIESELSSKLGSRKDIESLLKTIRE